MRPFAEKTGFESGEAVKSGNVYELPIVAGKYELLRSIPPEAFKEYASHILDFLPADGAILDTGFGPGHILTSLADEAVKRGSGNRLVGIDSSQEMHKLTKAELVSRGLSERVELVQEDAIEYLHKNKEAFDLIHFKAILHCFKDPEKVLDAMDYALKPGGYIVTGHEESQTESRIERLYDIYPHVDDPDLEAVFKAYFELRSEIAKKLNDPAKDFKQRSFPAADSSKAVEYFIAKGYVLDSSKDDSVPFDRSFTIQEVLDSIGNGTYGVFRDGLSEAEVRELYDRVSDFVLKEGIDSEVVRTVPAHLRQFYIKKHIT